MGDVERTEFDLSGAGSPGPARSDRPDRTDRTDRGNDALSDRMLPGDDDAELSLRPRSLTEFIGQPKVRGQLDLVLGGARARG
ncbi:MAG: Holliday junction branch migration DNA helicase RuvB, partial [Corynebacterium variabile]|nr:Holliday junction branch migration DNA helicase RuvB [Corynebacterium variabile]